MNELIQNSFNVPTMSSREIAELCDKEHRNVCRDIDNLNLEYGKLSLPEVGECDYTADNGQTYREFRLTKEQTIDLITGYRADVLTFQHIYLDSMNLTLSMANFHSPKRGSLKIKACRVKLSTLLP